MRFQPGGSGNPKGRPSKAEIAARAQAAPTGVMPAGTPRTPGTATAAQAAAAAVTSLSPAELDARFDSWSSELYGLGSETYDRRESARYTPTILPYHELARLWETESYIAKAIEAPGSEVFRTPFEIQVPGVPDDKYEGFKEDLEDELRDLGVEDRLERAYQYKRAYGGGAVLLGVDDGLPLWQPMADRDGLKLEYLETYEPLELVPYEIYLDPNRPNYGAVATYRLAASAGYGPVPGASSGRSGAPALDQTVVIHESRLVVFNGVEVSRYWRSTNLISPYWGTSVVPRFYQVLRDISVAISGVGYLMTDSAQPVISIDGLAEKRAKNEGVVQARMRALNMSRSIARAILLDAEREKFDRQQVNFGGMPEVLDRLFQYGAGATDIPLSIWLGYSPATLGKPDADELKLWYAQTSKRRRREFSPALRRIIKYVIPRIRKYKVPERWSIGWAPLEHLSLKDKVEMDRAMTQSDSIRVKAGLATSDEIRKTRYTRSGYSYETYFDAEKAAPGFIAPLPAGVMPKASPAMKVVESEEMEAAQGERGNGGPDGTGAKPGPGPDAHAVGGYVRKNPTAPAGGTAGASTGGDKEPELRDTRDHADASGGAVGDEGTEAQRRERVGDVPDLQKAERERMRLRAIHDAKLCDSASCPFCGPPRGDGSRSDRGVAPYEGEAPDNGAAWTTTMPRAAAGTEAIGDRRVEEPDLSRIEPPYPAAPGAEDSGHYEPAVATLEDAVGEGGDKKHTSSEEVKTERLSKEDATQPGLAPAIGARGGEASEDDVAGRADHIVEKGGEFVVTSKDGSKTFGRYKTRAEAEDRLRQVEAFKHADGEPDASEREDAIDIKDEILKLVALDYPADKCEWIKTLPWKGPMLVPTSRIDYSNAAKWHASTEGEEEKVEKFAKKIADGWSKPVILMRLPGKAHYMVVDGHHRALAARNAGKPILAYVGDAPTVKGPWDEFHDQQK